MATGKLDVKGLVSEARKQGYTDQQIYNELQKTPQFSNLAKEAKSTLKLNDSQLASQFGLTIAVKKAYEPFDWKKQQQQGMKDSAKQQGKTKGWESLLLGASDLGAGVLQGINYVGDAAAGVVNKALGTKLDTNDYEKYTKQRKTESDFHNLRRAENGQGFDGLRTVGQVVSTLPLGAAAKGYNGAAILSKAGAKVALQNGLVGGAISGAGFAENKNQRLGNALLGSVGGAVGGAVGEKVGQGVTKVARKLGPTPSITQAVDGQIELALKQSNMKIGDLSDDVIAGLRTDVAKAMKSGKAINNEALSRKIVFDRLGIEPTKAQLTGNPIAWQKQAELAKIQGAGDPLRQKLINNEGKLAGLLDDVIVGTGGKSPDQYGAIKGAADSLIGQNKQNKDFVGAAYDYALRSEGNNIVLDGRGFSNDAFTALEKQYAASSLPKGVEKILKDVNNNPEMFTLGKSEELIKVLNREYAASLQNNQPTSSTYAIGLVRDALKNRQGEAIQSAATSGNQAASAYQFARQSHQFSKQQIEAMPLLKDTLKGVEPDKLFQKHILGGNVSELKSTINTLKNVNPQSVADIKQQTAQWITDKSINQNGGFSPSGMKKALTSIGDRRLEALFTPGEVARLKDIGRAGEYIVTQPNHSYVNNSNTASALMNFFGGIINKPGVRVLLSPVKDVADSVKVNGALKATITNGKAPAAAATTAEQTLIDRLTKLGLLSGTAVSNK